VWNIGELSLTAYGSNEPVLTFCGVLKCWFLKKKDGLRDHFCDLNEKANFLSSLLMEKGSRRGGEKISLPWEKIDRLKLWFKKSPNDHKST